MAGPRGLGVEFRLLGPLEVRRGTATVDMGGHRQQAVLAALLMRANSVASIGFLAEAVWEVPPAAPESNIRTYIAGLRRRLRQAGADESGLATRAGGYLLTVAPVELDLLVFRNLAEQGERALRDGDAATAADRLGQALRLWRGEPLAGLPRPGPLLRAELTQLADQRLTVVERHAEAMIATGRPDPVLGELRTLLAEHPLREGLWAQLMLALHHTGRQADALDAFTQARNRLVDELGIEPGPHLRRVQQQILSGVVPAPIALRPSAAGAYRQLPMDIAEFTGRAEELRQLHALASNGKGRSQTAVVISAIEGMAGVGKTRLAVHAAHQLTARERFDEIQLWTDLHGFDPDRSPVDPSAALEDFLRLLGVPAQQIPADLDARAALYRDRLAGKRTLVLLDNAATESQVRPLLPGSPTCLVLITSRRTLTGLDGVNHLPLDVLAPAEAVSLLRRIAGHRRIDTDPDAGARIAELCGHLPIAVALAARRLQARPGWTARDLAERLEDDQLRLARLTGGGRDVHTVFDLSYQALPAARQRAFRRLGSHPGYDFAVDSAAALLDIPTGDAEILLEGLVDEHLLHQTTPGRYRFHDLIRAYIRERARCADDPADLDHVLARLLSWYLHAADAARTVLGPHHRRLIELGPWEGRSAAPVFPTYNHALAWCEAERTNLVSAVQAAAIHGLLEIAWQLPSTLLTFYYLRSHWTDWTTTHRIALDATRALGERRGEAIILRGLGVALSDLRRFDQAIDCHRQAQTIFEEIGDAHGNAWNLNNLGVVYVDLDRLDDATACLQRALPLFRQTGDRHGEGICLNNLGDTYRRRDRPADAIEHLEHARHIQQELGDQAGLRYTLASLGDVHRDARLYDQAIRRYRQAIDTSQALGDQRATARALVNLGQTYADAGDPAAAAEHRRRALDILDKLGDPQADPIRTLLRPSGT